MITDAETFDTKTRSFEPPKKEEYTLIPVSRFEGFEDLTYMKMGEKGLWYFDYMKED